MFDEREEWAEYRDATLEKWQRQRPGHRPAAWWKYDAPEPRQRLGGIGTPAHESLPALLPYYEMGLPSLWLSKFRCDYYNGQARDIHGNPIPCKWKPGDFTGLPPDRDNPPLFESEPAYLKRLGLLTTEESKMLKPADYQPVPLPTDYWPACR